ncbi:MAG: HlyD family efflux transporter periplasmic adaptor subunit [Cyanobacteria bacterium J007]|nr:MAG: HlyD family efflux transporter periplasmic adaptor subunit [Cyanobacteria bacterium J007]
MSHIISHFRATDEASDLSHKHRPPKILFFLPLLAIAGGVGWYAKTEYFSTPAVEALTLSGRIEGYETDIGAKIGGRVEWVAVREGDRVEAGMTVARLDDDEIRAQMEGASARIASAEQRERQARLQVEAISTQIEEAELNWQQARDDASGRIYQAQANLATAEAQLAQARAQVNQAESELKLARSDRDRFAPLLAEGAISQQQFDQTQARYETSLATVDARQAAVAAAERQVRATRGGLVQAETASLNPEIRRTQIERLQTQLEQARSQVEAARSEIANAQAARQEIAARLNDLSVASPIAGIVTVRSIEPGEVIAPGKMLLTVVDLNDVYLRGYLPEGRIGEVRVGQAAQVFLDSAPDRPLAATVTAIDTEASFTPENIYFKDDRVKQVFGLKLGIDNPQGFAKPGMPADAEILPEGG